MGRFFFARVHLMVYKNVRAIDLNLLLVFEALVVEASVSRAAQRLCLTQSGASRALARLRDHFGDPLFVSVGGALQMTRRAEQLAAPILDALSTLEQGLACADEFDPAASRLTFKIATADYCEALLFPPLIQQLNARAPGLHLESVATLPWDADRLEQREVDLVIALRPPDRTGLRGSTLLTETFVTLVQRNHPLVREGQMELSDWLSLKHLVVAPHGHAGSPIDDTLQRLDLSRTSFVRVHGFMAIGEMVVDTNLAATVPTSIARRLAQRYELDVVSLPFETPSFELAACWHERSHRDPGHRWLRSLVAEVARNVTPVSRLEASPARESQIHELARPKMPSCTFRS